MIKVKNIIQNLEIIVIFSYLCINQHAIIKCRNRNPKIANSNHKDGATKQQRAQKYMSNATNPLLKLNSIVSTNSIVYSVLCDPDSTHGPGDENICSAMHGNSQIIHIAFPWIL